MSAPLDILARFPPLHARKSPAISVRTGVLTGGIGLAIYFRSLRDLFPVELAVGLDMRSRDSNRRRGALGPIAPGTASAR